MPPCGTPAPVSPVLPPSGTTAIPAWVQARTAKATSSVLPGRSTARADPVNSLRLSTR